MFSLPGLNLRDQLGVGMVVLGILNAGVVFADQSTVTNPASNPNGAISASARLDFQINMGKFIFLRVGADSSTVDKVSFQLTPSIPSGGVIPSNGSNVAVNWNGAAPTFSTAATNNVVPVAVRSNAGQVSLYATVAVDLSNGTHTIPMSQILVSSSNAGLPAPVIPSAAMGTGASVNVTGTSFSGLVTVQNANWTFSYANTVSAAAGTYTGRITFVATAP